MSRGLVSTLDNRLMQNTNFNTHSLIFENNSYLAQLRPVYFSHFILTIYILSAADFECLSKPISCTVCNDDDSTCSVCSGRKTNNVAEYEAYSYALKLNSHISEFDLPVECYTGENCVDHFLDRYII